MRDDAGARNDGGIIPASPEGSRVLAEQVRLRAAMRRTLEAIAADMHGGLLETVGVKSHLELDDRAAMVLELPPDTDTELMARAVNMENVEAWRDEAGRVHVAVDPWYTTKDVDQAVLSVVKVVHVKLGIHAADAPPAPKKGLQRLLGSVVEVLQLQKQYAGKKDAE